MIRLCSYAATARQARLRSCAATTRQVLATAAAILGGNASLLACPACFGAQESSLIDGAKLGVAVLLAVTLAVQGAFLGFFLYLRRRAKRIADLDLDTEWSKLQGASRTS